MLTSEVTYLRAVYSGPVGTESSHYFEKLSERFINATPESMKNGLSLKLKWKVMKEMIFQVDKDNAIS